MEEDIMILESECYYLEELGYLKENNHFIRFNQALGNLIKRYKELEEENEKLINELQDKDDEIRFANRDIKVFETDFISKSKIKEKIDAYSKSCAVVDAFIVDVLQELMEDE